MSEEPNSERWMVSFADFMTLLFALFAVLYATSTHDLEKTKQFQESIKRYLIKAGAVGGRGEGKIGEAEKLDSPIEPPIQTYNTASPLSKETYDEAERFVEEGLSGAEQKKYVLDVQKDALGVRLILSAPEIFQSTKFRAQALPFLNRLGDLLTKIGRPVMVEGHLPRDAKIPSAFESAWEFSGARATTFVRFMIKSQKMDSTLFTPVAYGSSRPLIDGRRENDRLEVVILTEGMPL